MNKFMWLLATPVSRLLIRATVFGLASVLASKRTPLALRGSRETQLAFNFFNIRVFPGPAFGQNPIPRLLKSAAYHAV
jgi:hypothetical protein